MRSAVGKRVLGLTNRLAAASPTMVDGLPIYDLSHPAGGEAAEPGRSSGVGGSSGDILASEDGGGAYVTVGDATVVIQSGPSPPVFEDPRSKGGVSRDWGIIFDVYREDYASKVIPAAANTCRLTLMRISSLGMIHAVFITICPCHCKMCRNLHLV
jgi:hypothetical protein